MSETTNLENDRDTWKTRAEQAEKALAASRERAEYWRSVADECRSRILKMEFEAKEWKPGTPEPMLDGLSIEVWRSRAHEAEAALDHINDRVVTWRQS